MTSLDKRPQRRESVIEKVIVNYKKIWFNFKTLFGNWLLKMEVLNVGISKIFSEAF